MRLPFKGVANHTWRRRTFQIARLLIFFRLSELGAHRRQVAVRAQAFLGLTRATAGACRAPATSACARSAGRRRDICMPKSRAPGETSSALTSRFNHVIVAAFPRSRRSAGRAEKRPARAPSATRERGAVHRDRAAHDRAALRLHHHLQRHRGAVRTWRAPRSLHAPGAALRTGTKWSCACSKTALIMRAK
jgi:hypothetical protein